MLVADWFGSFSNLNIFHLNNFLFCQKACFVFVSFNECSFFRPRILFSSVHFYFLLRVFSIIYANFGPFSSMDGIFSFFVRNKGRKFLICLTPKLYPRQNLAMRKSVSTILTQDIHIREFNKRKATFLGSIFSNILTAIPHLKITSFQVSLISKLNRRKPMGPW